MGAHGVAAQGVDALDLQLVALERLWPRGQVGQSQVAHSGRSQRQPRRNGGQAYSELSDGRDGLRWCKGYAEHQAGLPDEPALAAGGQLALVHVRLHLRNYLVQGQVVVTACRHERSGAACRQRCDRRESSREHRGS